MFKAESSPEKCWRRPRSQEVAGGGGGGGGGGCRGGGETIPNAAQNEWFLHSDGQRQESFIVSWIVRDRVKRQCPQTTTVEEKGQPQLGIEPMSSAYQLNASPLGLTGSQS